MPRCLVIAPQLYPLRRDIGISAPPHCGALTVLGGVCGPMPPAARASGTMWLVASVMKASPVLGLVAARGRSVAAGPIVTSGAAAAGKGIGVATGALVTTGRAAPDVRRDSAGWEGRKGMIVLTSGRHVEAVSGVNRHPWLLMHQPVNERSEGRVIEPGDWRRRAACANRAGHSPPAALRRCSPRRRWCSRPQSARRQSGRSRARP